MKKTYCLFLGFAALSIVASCNQKSENSVAVETKIAPVKHQEIIVNTPDEAIAELKAGNQRFLNDSLINTNHLEQIEHTKHGQQPHSVILSCMDSRVPPEIVMDQGIGNVFDIRNAGNLEDHNVLGSMEYAVEHSAKLIVVLGHSHCGAVTGAINEIKLGHLTQLVEQITPAITQGETKAHTIAETAKQSIKNTIKDILERSEHIREKVDAKKIKIVGAFYDIETGEVLFMD
jgi:carbonic anhydrase